MKYILISAFLACAAPSVAQTPAPAAAPTTAAGVDKDIRLQSPDELAKTALWLENALRVNPADVDLNVKLGFTYTRLGKADEAQKAFESAARLNPKKAIAQYMLGLIYEKKGMREQAIAAWKACLENASEPELREKAVKHLSNLAAK